MKNDIRLGIVLMVSATLFFAVMDGVSRYLAETYNVMVINMLRAWVLALIVILISMRKGKGIKKVSISGNYFLQIIRGVILITCVCIGVYSFALKPEEHQPSGTCNFSRIDNAVITNDASRNTGVCYAVNYNVLRIMSGMGGLAYSN